MLPMPSCGPIWYAPTGTARHRIAGDTGQAEAVKVLVPVRRSLIRTRTRHASGPVLGAT